MAIVYFDEKKEIRGRVQASKEPGNRVCIFVHMNSASQLQVLLVTSSDPRVEIDLPKAETLRIYVRGVTNVRDAYDLLEELFPNIRLHPNKCPLCREEKGNSSLTCATCSKEKARGRRQRFADAWRETHPIVTEELPSIEELRIMAGIGPEDIVIPVRTPMRNPAQVQIGESSTATIFYIAIGTRAIRISVVPQQEGRKLSWHFSKTPKLGTNTTFIFSQREFDQLCVELGDANATDLKIMAQNTLSALARTNPTRSPQKTV